MFTSLLILAKCPHAKSVLERSPAEFAGIKIGDKLLSIDHGVFRSLGFSAGVTSKVGVSIDGVDVTDYFLAPVTESIQEALLNASKGSERIVSVNGKKIGYFHLWSGTNDEFFNAMNATLDRFEQKSLDGVVLDLRDGFGGAYPGLP